MAFHTVSRGNAVDIKKTTDPIVGLYQGRKDIETKIGKQVIWQFLDENEKPFGVYGFTALNMGMENIVPGTLVRMTYTGTVKKQTKFGLRDVHTVNLEVDDGK